MTDEQKHHVKHKYCSDCKHHRMVSGVVHQVQCVKYGKDGNTIPCVLARMPEHCNDGKGWERQ